MNIFTTLLTQPLANGLVLFYRVLGNNMGLAILIFSISLWVALRPLTKPYMESMKRIKEVAPQLEKLKKKYKNDKVKLAKAQADLYKEKNINPGAGCLPYLLQIAILFAFFGMFNKTLGNGGDLTNNFNQLLYEPLRFSPGEVINTRFLYLDVVKPDVFNIAGINFPIPGPLILLAAIAQFVSAKIMQPYTNIEEKVAKQTKNETDDMQVSIQKSMIYTFPLMTVFIGTRFASGLALYWLVFSIMQAYQQYKSQGWGGMSPLIKRLNLVRSSSR